MPVDLYLCRMEFMLKWPYSKDFWYSTFHTIGNLLRSFDFHQTPLCWKRPWSMVTSLLSPTPYSMQFTSRSCSVISDAHWSPPLFELPTDGELTTEAALYSRLTASNVWISITCEELWDVLSTLGVFTCFFNDRDKNEMSKVFTHGYLFLRGIRLSTHIYLCTQKTMRINLYKFYPVCHVLAEPQIGFVNVKFISCILPCCVKFLYNRE